MSDYEHIILVAFDVNAHLGPRSRQAGPNFGPQIGGRILRMPIRMTEHVLTMYLTDSGRWVMAWDEVWLDGEFTTITECLKGTIRQLGESA